MTKPAKEGQDGFDPKELLKDDAADERDDAPEGDDEHASDDDLSLDELDAQLRKSIEGALQGEDGDEAEDEDAEGDEDETAEEKIKRLEAEMRDLRRERKKKALVEARVEAAREVAAVVREFKLQKEELAMVVRFFQKNPEMEGVVPFRQAAIRVLGLGDRASSSDSGGRNGDSRRSEGAHVITRGGGAPPPRRQAFKPTPERGNYSGVTAAILASGSARKLIATD